MSAAERLQHIPVDDYLAGELTSDIKHEYVNGVVYAMAGATNAHNAIATNTLVALAASKLRGGCRPFNSDTKVRVRTASSTKFYYPDVSVVCQQNAPTETFQDQPVLIVEVLSRATRRIDEQEKKADYLSIPTLNVYLLIEQDSPGVVVYRRGEAGFTQETHVGMDAIIPLDELGAVLSLADIYDGIEFVPEPSDEAD